MTYPYGTKGAPVVGNGLGGLPRRGEAAAAAVAGGPKLFERVGDFVQVNTSVSNPGYPTAWGRKIGVDGGKMFFKWRRQDGGGNTNFVLCGAAYSGSGVTGSLSESNFGTTAGPWNELAFCNSWSSGDSAYFYDRANNSIVKVSAPTTSLIRTTVKTTAIPLSGSFTVGGNSYNIYETGTSYFAGDNTPSNTYAAAQALPDGGVVIVRLVTNTSLTQLQYAAFVFDSSWNLIRSFPIHQVNLTTSSPCQLFLVLPVSNSTEMFSIFSVVGTNTSTPGMACATFNCTTGSVSKSGLSTFSVAATTFIGQTTYTHTKNSVQIFLTDTSSNLTRRVVFPIQEDFSVVSSGTVTQNVYQNPYIAPMPAFRAYDPEFADYYDTSQSLAILSPFVQSSGSQFFFQAVPTLQEVTSLSYSQPNATGEVSVISAKGVTVIESENQSLASDLGAGALPLARVSANSYVGAYYDARTSSNSTILRAQLMRTP